MGGPFYKPCPNGRGIYSPPWCANISDEMVIMTCIAKECPNHIFTGNRVKSRHTPNEDFVTYTGFE